MNKQLIIDFIHEIKNLWCTSKNEEARKRGETLSKIIQNNVQIFDEWESELKCDPPSINFQEITIPSQLDNTDNKEMFASFIKSFDYMPWKHPKQLSSSLTDILQGEDNFKSAMLVGTRELGAVIESSEMYLGLTYLSTGTTYPQHSHDATELYFTLLGSPLWGPSLRHLKLVSPGNFVLHSSAQPHAFYASTSNITLMRSDFF
jgi:hypothetical protein